MTADERKNSNAKNIIITGGSSGIGYETAKLFLDSGYKVLILSRSSEKCGLLKEYPGFCYAKNTDVSEILQIESALVYAKKIFKAKKIDCLINCAGVGYPKNVIDFSEADYNRIFDVNVKGTIFTSKIFLPLIKKQTGVICNISSIAGIKGFSEWSLYCASKFAVEGFSESLRHELRNDGIRVVCIRPGAVETPLYSFLPKKLKKDFMTPETIAKVIMTAVELPPEACVENMFINNSAGDL
ncbi:MAG: SDR family oxidoreductase [Candidatus Wallbacteria bacterium]